MAYNQIRMGSGTGANRRSPRKVHAWRQFFIRIAFSWGLLLGISLQAGTTTNQVPANADLNNMSLEQLMNVEVTTVSKHPEKYSEAPAAIYVVTQEDIRRSGANTIADVLRMVPGLDVAQINPSTWAISSRGFNSRFSNKLQVLVDGRSTYNSIFSGVYWFTLDPMLEDLDRIEVIRGPGASLWGANAVNGVINIITKSAKETQGTLIVAGGGNLEPGFGGVRYGGKIDDTTFYRVYFTGSDFGRNMINGSQPADDGINEFQGGFRLDADPSAENSFTVQGDLNTNFYQSNSPTNFFSTGEGNVLARWKHTFSDTSDLTVQSYYDQERRSFSVITIEHTTVDLDLQHRFALGDRNEVMWGAGYQFYADKTHGVSNFSLLPAKSTDHLSSAFLQDDLTLVPEHLHFIAGSKFEHNDYTGVEIQPNARLLWTPTTNQTLWASVSRAVRSPSRSETALQAYNPIAPGLVTGVFGNPDFESEKLTAYELGYRIYPHPDLSLDLATYYNVYDDLRSFTQGTPFFSGGNVVIPLTVNNKMQGESYGLEFSAGWQATRQWRLNASYTLLQMHLRDGRGLNDSTLEASAKDNPQQQFQVRSYLDLPAHLELDTAAYYVDSLPGQGVPGYVRLDLRLGWRPTKNFEASVGLQNLLQKRHAEYGNNFLVAVSQPERAVYAKVTIRF